MARIEPLRREDLPQHEATFRAVENALGVLPNSTLTMAYWPELMDAFARLNAVVMSSGRVSGVLKQMVAAMVSSAAGCAFCQAHTAHVAERRGADEEKLAALWDFEISPLFTASERAALRVAHRAGLVPNEVSDEDMVELRRHFSDVEVVELVAVMANFGFLNRWNDTMSTQLERPPPRGVPSICEAQGGTPAATHLHRTSSRVADAALAWGGWAGVDNSQHVSFDPREGRTGLVHAPLGHG